MLVNYEEKCEFFYNIVIHCKNKNDQKNVVSSKDP